MHDEVEMLEMAAEKLEKTVEEVNQVEERLMCQYDTMSELFFEEKKLLLDQLADERKRYDEAEKRHAEKEEAILRRDGRIMLAISLALLLVIGSLIGAIIYVTSNYDIAYEVYQDVSAEGGGDSTVEDGIHLNGTPVEK